jgi:peptide chain release factor 2
MSAPSFWDNQKGANRTVEELKILKDDVDAWSALSGRLSDVRELLELSDSSLDEELHKEVAFLSTELERFRLRMLFRGKFDAANAIIEINSGAGGTEACDWAQMLLRMYTRWAENKRFSARIIDEVRGEEVGYRSVTFIIEGKLAYGHLTSETGVHRLVRISPFDANKRRHTSFASVAVYPEVKDDVEIEIKPEEIKVDTFRAGGAGGQHVNVTDSAVRVTHIPTGLVVSCQNERSQHQNKHNALRVLKAKLYELYQEQRKKDINKLSGQKRRIEWGSQIRSYVLCPYLLVKDHRTNHEEHNAKAVLDGNLDDFMITYLKQRMENDSQASS